MKDKKILVVEDNPRSLRLIKLLLSHQNYQIFEAKDGISGLNMALKIQPDLIVMDIQLPGISGLDITRELRQTEGFKKIPIIAITAYAMKSEQENILQAGCTACLSKPIDTRELPKQIECWLRHGESS